MSETGWTWQRIKEDITTSKSRTSLLLLSSAVVISKSMY